MKRIAFFAILTIVAVVSSCSNVNGNRKGADEKALREDLLSKTLVEHVTMLQSLTPEDQYKYWLKKMDNTLSSKNLTKEEKKIIQPLMDKMSPIIYRYKDSEESRKYRDLTEQVANTLKSEFGWDDYKLFKYFETILTEEEYDEYMKRNNRENLL